MDRWYTSAAEPTNGPIASARPYQRAGVISAPQQRVRLPETTAPKASASPVRALVYQSTPIFERRRRILHEARAIISELGYENLSIRELARRAEVAQRTLYNAFGSRENIVISAIQEYLKDFSDRVHYAHSSYTVVGRLERLIGTHSRNLQIRPYTTAVMSVYNSQACDPSIRRAIRQLSHDQILPFAEHLAAGRKLAANVTPIGLTESLTTLLYSTLSSWCVGEIPDDSMVERLVETFLMVTASSSIGATREEALKWLGHLRACSAEWEQLRAAAAVPDQPRSVARRSDPARCNKARSRPNGCGEARGPPRRPGPIVVRAASAARTRSPYPRSRAVRGARRSLPPGRRAGWEPRIWRRRPAPASDPSASAA